MNTVIFYTTHCPKCSVVEAKLKQKGIEYEECSDVDVMKQKGLMYAPALEVNGEVLSFTDALEFIKNYQNTEELNWN